MGRISQSRRLSLVEAITNVVVGYALAVVAKIVRFPWFGLHPSRGENRRPGGLFTGVSLVRGYALHGLFERWLQY